MGSTWGWGWGGVAMLDWMANEGLSKKMTFEKIPDGVEETDHVEIWGKDNSATGAQVQRS